MIAGAGAVILAVVAYTWLRPVAAPQVANYVQLTHDGLQKSLIGTDGSRLFLTVVDSGVEDAAAVPVAGGEPTRIAFPSPGMFPVDLAADGSSFLVVDGTGYPATGPLWSLPVLGDSPRRLGDATGHIAAWSADGKQLAIGKDNDVYLAKGDGNGRAQDCNDEESGVGNAICRRITRVFRSRQKRYRKAERV